MQWRYGHGVWKIVTHLNSMQHTVKMQKVIQGRLPKKKNLQRSVEDEKLVTYNLFVLFTALGSRQLWTKINSTSSNLCTLIELLLIYMLIFCHSIMLFGIGSLGKMHVAKKKVNQALSGDGCVLACRQKMCIYYVYPVNWALLCEACTRTYTDTGSKATGKSKKNRPQSKH